MALLVYNGTSCTSFREGDVPSVSLPSASLGIKKENEQVVLTTITDLDGFVVCSVISVISTV